MITLAGTQTAYHWLSSTPQRLPAADVADARRFRRECTAWMRDAGVQAYALADKDPAFHGPLREPALRFYVKKKKAARSIKQGLIPSVIRLPDGRRVYTDVMTALAPTAACAPGGTLYSETVGPGDFGTATCVAYSLDNPNRLYLLSAWHVVCGTRGRSGDTIFCAGTPCGVLSGKYQSLSLDAQRNLAHVQSFDGALVELRGTGASPFNATMQLAFAGMRQTPVGKGDLLHSYGSASGRRREGRVIEAALTDVIGYRGGFATYSHLIKTEAVSRKGDSGAPVTDADGRLAGFVIADDATTGHDDAEHTWIQPIQEVFREYAIGLAGGEPPTAAAAGGPAMNPLNGLAHSKDTIDILARTLWGEARGESLRGRQAVCWVIVNRANLRLPRFGLSIAEVCQKPYQFSCWNPGDPNRRKLQQVTTADTAFRECLEIARAAIAARLPADPTKGSRHYHAAGVEPNWAAGKTPAARIGRHLFYNDVN